MDSRSSEVAGSAITHCGVEYSPCVNQPNLLAFSTIITFRLASELCSIYIYILQYELTYLLIGLPID